MHRRSGLTLFLMEQLIVIAVFAVCAAACVKILVDSYFVATQTRDLSNAIRVAESGAECYKAASGDVGKIAEILGGKAENAGTATAIVHYDEDWRVCGEENASYRLRLVRGNKSDGAQELLQGELLVEKITDEAVQEIIVFPVAALASNAQ